MAKSYKTKKTECIYLCVENFFKKYNLQKNNVWLAYSGGIDSQVLLHILLDIRKNHPDIYLNAVHINHGLSEKSDLWEQFCQKQCHILSVNYHSIRVEIKQKSGESIESNARQIRYQAILNLLSPGDVLFTAHHIDDQAETCLLQLLRGCGVKGLASMPKMMSFSQIYLARPLLNCTRSEISDYAYKNKLEWIEDHSNQDIRFTRNFLRHKIIPILQQRWPNISNTISRVASHCTEADRLLAEIAKTDLIKLSLGKQLCVINLRKLNLPRQKNVIRYWLQQLGFSMPSSKKLKHLIEDVVMACDDAKPCVGWHCVEVRRFQNKIYAIKPLLTFNPNLIYSWKPGESLILPHGALSAKLQKGKGAKLPVDKVEIRFRQGGEACHLPGLSGSQKLKKLFQSWNVAPWLRNRIPLIYSNNELAVIVGYAICSKFVVNNPDENGWIISF